MNRRAVLRVLVTAPIVGSTVAGAVMATPVVASAVAPRPCPFRLTMSIRESAQRDCVFMLMDVVDRQTGHTVKWFGDVVFFKPGTSRAQYWKEERRAKEYLRDVTRMWLVDEGYVRP